MGGSYVTSISNQNGSSRIGTAVTLFFFLFVSLLAFAVGTFVGKSMSDSEYREAALERGDYKEFRTPASEETTDTASGESLKPEEVEELKNAFLKSQEEHTDAAEGEHAEHNEHAKDTKVTEDGYRKIASEGKTAKHDATKAAAERVAEGKAPAKDEPPKRLPSSVLPGLAASAVGKFTVQIASYATQVEAEKHASDLKSKGYSAFYIPAEINKTTWYRVSVGLFSDQKAAADYRKQLMRDAKIETALIQKIVQ